MATILITSPQDTTNLYLVYSDNEGLYTQVTSSDNIPIGVAVLESVPTEVGCYEGAVKINGSEVINNFITKKLKVDTSEAGNFSGVVEIGSNNNSDITCELLVQDSFVNMDDYQAVTESLIMHQYKNLD